MSGFRSAFICIMAIWSISHALAQNASQKNDVQINPGVLDALTGDLSENEASPKDKIGTDAGQLRPKAVPLPQVQVQGAPDYSVAFRTSESSFSSAQASELRSWVSTMTSNGKTVEIRAYADAGSEPAQIGDLVRISYHRAEALRALILEAGLEADRINIRAMGPDADPPGKTNPDRADIYLLSRPLSNNVQTP